MTLKDSVIKSSIVYLKKISWSLGEMSVCYLMAIISISFPRNVVSMNLFRTISSMVYGIYSIRQFKACIVWLMYRHSIMSLWSLSTIQTKNCFQQVSSPYWGFSSRILMKTNLMEDAAIVFWAWVNMLEARISQTILMMSGCMKIC